MATLKIFKSTPIWDELIMKLGNPAGAFAVEPEPAVTPLWDELTSVLPDPCQNDG